MRPAASPANNACSKSSGIRSNNWRRPTVTSVWSITARTPKPGRFSKSLTAPGTGTAAATAPATGCSERASTAAAQRTKWSASTPTVGTTSTSSIRPSVIVPVLSKTMWVIARVLSSTSPPLIMIPKRAPRPVPTMMAVGVAKPSAQGQAITSTATAAVNASLTAWPVANQATKVTAAIPKATGTNTAETRSANRCTGAVEPWASSTKRMICAKVVSPPTRVASTMSEPVVFTVAPITSSPTFTVSGTGSPVIMEASIAELPSTILPSVGIFSPGRTTKRIPTSRASKGISVPSSKRAVRGLKPAKARMASPERCLARASNHLPNKIRATMAAAVSK